MREDQALLQVRLDQDLVRRVKIRVAKDGIKIKDFVEAAIVERLRTVRP
jgi:predicted DNA binding CopG/RHH family protein